jgi:predicted CXXCH cytochrome family protein
VGLCFTCHGTGALGSNEDVQTAFSNESSHSLEPQGSPFGPLRKNCGTCHDSHGTAKDAAGNPYPALLRVADGATAVYSGEEYCAACHKPGRPASLFSSLAVFKTTKHYSQIPPPASGSKIRCDVCHDPHGSPLPATVRTELVPPAAPATATVTGDDRTQCLACHAAASGTWPGGSVYAGSGLALSSKTTPIAAEWATDYGKASQVATRAVGECQNCHDPMGRDNGSGVALPKLVTSAGSSVCYSCHDVKGPASANMAALALRSSAVDRQIVVGWAPDERTASSGRVSVWTSDASSSPGAVFGPREFVPSGMTGAVASGDINGDGHDEVIVAQRGVAQLNILAPDAFKGISEVSGPGIQTIDATASLVAVGDVLPDASGRAEIAVVNQPSGELRLYRLVGTSLQLVAGPLPVGAGASGIAIGNVTSSAFADIVVTSATDNVFRVFSGSGGVLTASAPHATRLGPRGPSIGPVLDGSTDNGIVIVNGGQTGGTATVSIFKGDGSLVADYDTTPASLVPVASVVGDVLGGSAGAEIAVTLDGPAGSDGYVDVFSRTSTTGYGVPQAVRTGRDYHPTGLAAGDVDGDGRKELVVVNAGLWRSDSNGQDASVQVLQADAAGTSIESTAARMFWAGGRELAGGTPSLSIADLGAFGLSRHPMDVGGASHVSTEVATPDARLPRHVVCADCHNPHSATAASAVAPNVIGPLAGAWGVSVTNTSKTQVDYVERRGVRYEYEVCMKCHSSWSDLRGGANLAFEVNPLNASVHAVEQSAASAQVPDGTWSKAGLSNSTILYCTDCHGNSALAEAKGPHRSASAPLLAKPVAGLRATDTSMLCYGCHSSAVYALGTGAASRFSNAGASLHAQHVGVGGFSCGSCHAAHGSVDNPALVRADVGFTAFPTGGSCVNTCHSDARQTYTR